MKGFLGVQIDARKFAARLLSLGGGKTIANKEELLKRVRIPFPKPRMLVNGAAALPPVFSLNSWTEPNRGLSEEMSR
jgi:hypothetical protein